MRTLSGSSAGKSFSKTAGARTTRRMAGGSGSENGLSSSTVAGVEFDASST